MTNPELRGKPKLTEFVGGFGGPAAIEYRGGTVKVIAAIIYRDGLVMEWLVGPVPDLSSIPDIDQSTDEQLSSSFPRLRNQPDRLESLRRFKRLSTFWERSTLSDDLGGRYQWVSGDAGSTEGGGYKGHES